MSKTIGKMYYSQAFGEITKVRVKSKNGLTYKVTIYNNPNGGDIDGFRVESELFTNRAAAVKYFKNF